MNPELGTVATRLYVTISDDLWLVDSTPVECARSRETVKRSDLAGWAEYGYCASHSRYFWGLRLHLIATPSGLPIAYALAGAKTDERDTALDMIAFGDLDHEGQALIADKGYRRASFETELNDAGITLIRPRSNPRNPDTAADFSKRSAKRSNPSTRPSKASSNSNFTSTEAGQESAPAYSLLAYDH